MHEVKKIEHTESELGAFACEDEDKSRDKFSQSSSHGVRMGGLFGPSERISTRRCHAQFFPMSPTAKLAKPGYLPHTKLKLNDLQQIRYHFKHLTISNNQEQNLKTIRDTQISKLKFNLCTTLRSEYFRETKRETGDVF